MLLMQAIDIQKIVLRREILSFAWGIGNSGLNLLGRWNYDFKNN